MKKVAFLFGTFFFLGLCGHFNMAGARGPSRMDTGQAMGGRPGGVSHQTHLNYDWGPKLGDKCYTCHDGKPGRRTVNYAHCNPCHSPDGAFDGVNDPVIGARYNWGRMSSLIYDDDSASLRPGKEEWCVGCHDDKPAVIDNTIAPNISGRSMTGDWQSPFAIAESDIPGASNLLDGDPGTGNTGSGSYVIFDLGEVTDISHIRIYTSSDDSTLWEVYGGSDLTSWTRILLGQSVIFSAPAWEIGKAESWNSNRLDNFIPIRYLKLVRIPVGSLENRYLCEVEFKKDLRYGYYVNGHKIGCDNCHDVKSDHIDGISRTYRAYLNNYNSGYRLMDVETSSGTVPAMEIPRTGCSSSEDLETTNDFALCFKCHDRTKVLGDADASGIMFQYPLQTNFRNDTHVDNNGHVQNEHVRHMRGRGYCGNSPDWDSDWNGTPDSPMSCTACHNVHGSPTPAMTRHGELVSSAGTYDSVPMINFKYIGGDDSPDPDMSNVMQSTGGITQFYGPGPGTVDKNATCKMCHNDSISYRRTPIYLGHSLVYP